MPKTLMIDKLRLDGDTQSRASVNEVAVDEYEELWKSANGKSPFPPVDVFHDGSAYWLADGFHRVLSASRAGLKKLQANVHKGTKRDAFLFAAKSNTSHGLRRTNQDKRYLVCCFLKDEEWGKKSARWIAEACGVSGNFVSEVRKQTQLSSDDSSHTRVTGQDGKSRPARRKKKAPKVPPLVKPPEKCPNCGHTEFDSDGDCLKCREPTAGAHPKASKETNKIGASKAAIDAVLHAETDDAEPHVRQVIADHLEMWMEELRA